MNKLKRSCQPLLQGIKRVCFLPQTIASLVKRRQQQKVLNGLEAERLDRIRNPSKYLGM